MKKQVKKSAGNLFFNIVMMLVISFLIMGTINCWVGYTSFSSTLTETYEDFALGAARVAEEYLDADKLISFIEKKRADSSYNAEDDPDYQQMLSFLQQDCDSNRMLFMYVVEASYYSRHQSYTAKTAEEMAVGYGYYDVIMEVVGENYQDSYTPWEFGDRNTTKIEYAELYKGLYEGTIEEGFACLPRPYSTTENGGPHISILLPLKGEDGNVKAVLCALIHMDHLTEGRSKYLFKAIIATLALLAATVAVTAWIIKKSLVAPVKMITGEANRFAAENSPAEEKLLSRLPTKITELKTLAGAIDAMEEENLNYVRSITSMTAENERIGTELNIAKLIQEGSIPSVFPAFPERDDIDLYGSMTAAKEVGGDFYDFYFLDDDHLLMVMADVSGKGVPAALFMMITKILISDRALMGGSPAEILSFVNERICKNNSADMFVTVWLGILELSTGRLVSVNAGHEDPAICRRGGEFAIGKSRHSFVVGGMPGVKYQIEEHRLEPGDKIFLYTDGIPEATDGEKRMFGLERLAASLNAVRGGTPREVIDRVNRDVNSFAGDAPQFDDMTMLCLEFKSTGSAEAVFDAELSNLDDVMGFTDAFLGRIGCGAKAQMQIDLAIEELFVNVANYAYGGEAGPVRIRLSESGGVVTVVVSDDGVPYDPLQKEDPDTALSADERPIGGLGIFIVKKNMDSVVYTRENGSNVLTMTKKI